MTLNEAIEHAEQVACDLDAADKKNPAAFREHEQGQSCAECAAEHRQLAEWLRELSVRRMVAGTEHDELIRRANQHYGMSYTCQIAMEECGELIAAISHFLRMRPGALENLAEELADVRLMSERIISQFGLGPEVRRWHAQKLARMERRIKGEE